MTVSPVSFTLAVPLSPVHAQVLGVWQCGHVRTPENTYWEINNNRSRCKPCHRRRGREQSRARRGATTTLKERGLWYCGCERTPENTVGRRPSQPGGQCRRCYAAAQRRWDKSAKGRAVRERHNRSLLHRVTNRIAYRRRKLRLEEEV